MYFILALIAIKIKQQSERPTESNGLQHNNEENTNINYKSYLDILFELNAKDPTFTMEQVRNEVDTIIFGGQETIATALFYTLLMVGCHPHVQDKLHAEIKEIFGNGHRELTKQDLDRMKYCEAVIYETLRLFPPVPLVYRAADRELQLKSCKVSKGMFCVANIYGVGHSKTYWGPDAHEFRPERFQSGCVPVLIPFSTGRRACIGKRYAIPMLKTVIAYCVKDLIFTAEADKIELIIDIMLRTVSERILEVKLRQN